MAKQLTLPMDALPAPKAKPPKCTPEQAWLAWAAAEWAAFHRAPMTIRWARDVTLIRPLLHLHGEDELKLRWQAFISTMDEYFARRGWDVPCFCAAIDRYLGKTDRVPLVRQRQISERLLDEERASRDPLTGVDRRTLRRGHY